MIEYIRLGLTFLDQPQSYIFLDQTSQLTSFQTPNQKGTQKARMIKAVTHFGYLSFSLTISCSCLLRCVCALLHKNKITICLKQCKQYSEINQNKKKGEPDLSNQFPLPTS